MLRLLLGLGVDTRTPDHLLSELKSLFKGGRIADADPATVVELCQKIRGRKLASFRHNMVHEFREMDPDCIILMSEFTEFFAVTSKSGVTFLGRFDDFLYPVAPEHHAAINDSWLEFDAALFYDHAIEFEKNVAAFRVSAKSKKAKVHAALDETQYPEVPGKLEGYRYIVIQNDALIGAVLIKNGFTLAYSNAFENRPIKNFEWAIDENVVQNFGPQRIVSDLSLTLQSMVNDGVESDDFTITELYLGQYHVNDTIAESRRKRISERFSRFFVAIKPHIDAPSREITWQLEEAGDYYNDEVEVYKAALTPTE